MALWGPQPETVAPSPRKGIGRRAVVIGAVLLVLAAFASQLQRTTNAGPAASRSPVTVQGEGIMASAPFQLGRGDWLVSWRAEARPGSDSCYHGAGLYTRAGERAETLVSAGVGRGETWIYGLDAGTYYVDASSGCVWSFTFAPR